MMTTIIVGIVCLVVGFGVGKFWKSRKINETVSLAKQMAKDPSTAKDKIGDIVDIWK